MKTGGHIKPCKVAAVELHNERDQEYVERMKTSKHPLHFFPNLALRPNQNWRNENYRDETTGKPLKVAQVFKRMVDKYTEKDKRGRRPPLKDRERIDPNTGKVKTIAGWSPIREMVVVIKPDTKIEDFDKVKAWFKQNGVGTMFLSLHFDEGHLDEHGNLKANNHAHMGLDFFNWETGKTVKLGPKKMKELQTVLADALGMERGEVKEITGAEHLNVVEQRIDAKKKQILSKALSLVGGSDKTALEAAQSIIADDKLKVQRNLLTSEQKLRKAEKKLATVEEREQNIDSIIEGARNEERSKLQELQKKYDAVYKLYTKNSEQLNDSRTTIADLQKTVDGKKKYIDFLNRTFLSPLIAIFRKVMNTFGHKFEGDDAGFIKTIIRADSHEQEQKNADFIWNFVTNDMGVRTHTAWMNDTKRNLDRLADEGWVQNVDREQSNQIKMG